MDIFQYPLLPCVFWLENQGYLHGIMVDPRGLEAIGRLLHEDSSHGVQPQQRSHQQKAKEDQAWQRPKPWSDAQMMNE